MDMCGGKVFQRLTERDCFRLQFNRMRPQIFAYFQIHSIQFGKETADRKPVIRQVGLNLTT
jgi:hypothetical protein